MKFSPGEKVRVKKVGDIKKTLDNNNCCEGLLFGEEMEKFCGNVYTVLKEVKKIVDYYNKGIRKFKNTYILDEVHCGGTIEYPQCDRMCLLFWKDKWLEKFDES